MYPPQATATTTSVTQVKDVKFPAMPQTLTELLHLRASPSLDVERLIEVVKKDPAVTAGVLRRVNAAYYGVSRQVSRIDKAVNLLGYREVFGLVLSAVVKQTFVFRGAEDAAAIYRHIMRSSAATAAFSRLLAEQLGGVYAEVAFTAGLLSQLGRQVLLHHVARPYVELWLRLSPTNSLEDLAAPTPQMEAFVFNTDSARLGVLLAEQWGLPDEVQATMRFQQDAGSVTVPAARVLALVVAAAQSAAATLFETADREVELRDHLTQLKDLRSADPDALYTLLAENSKKVRQFAEDMVSV